MKRYIIVIPAEGDSVATESWYVQALRNYYERQRQPQDQLEVLVFRHSENPDVVAGTREGVEEFVRNNWFEDAEIHAQGGFGAYVALRLCRACPEQIRRVFFIGGAPSDAMPPIQKWFHRSFARLWYRLPVKFFADDPKHPDPEIDETIQQIRASSTACMRANPLRYRNQLVHIGYWNPRQSDIPQRPDFRAYYVPNGKTFRSETWDNSYDDAAAREAWQRLGVDVTDRPGNFFSFYSMMPAEELFMVMDLVRGLWVL